MSSLGRTLFRFSGALLLAGAGTAVDRGFADGGSADGVPPSGPPTRDARTPSPPAPVPNGLADRTVVFPLRFTDHGGVARFIEPGSRADVLVLVPDPADPARRTPKLFMESVRVREIRHPAEPVVGTPDTPVAMIEVSSDEMDKLLVAQRLGVLSLVPARRGDPDARMRDAGVLRRAISSSGGAPFHPPG
ncbi:MAG TPA: RcpC/CpaB family pilus assembly protein [Gemmatimonadaceae bacterium]|nr:RcpC/CpaB family pilus assembly protein [Gemmatimonadaceae bacterium]